MNESASNETLSPGDIDYLQEHMMLLDILQDLAPDVYIDLLVEYARELDDPNLDATTHRRLFKLAALLTTLGSLD